MKVICSIMMLGCAVFGAMGYPYAYYPNYGNMDSLSYGSNDNSRGGMVMSRYYNPYYDARSRGGGMAAFLVRQEEQSSLPQTGQYYQPDRRRQTQNPLDIYVPPQQNEVYYPQPENPIFSTPATDLVDPTEKTELTTEKAIVPEISEPEVPEVEEVAEPSPKSPKAKKNSSKKKPVKPIDDEEDDEERTPHMPQGAFFPMFFGYGGRGAAPGGPMAIANAYSTGRGGVATSHATAYGSPRPEDPQGPYYKNNVAK